MLNGGVRTFGHAAANTIQHKLHSNHAMDSGEGLTQRLRRLVVDEPAIELFVLFGSRGRGEARPQADWDFAYLTCGKLDIETLRARLVLALESDRVDLVDLDRAGGLLRFHVARDGKLIVERTIGAWERFKLDATRFWCDAESVLRNAYEQVLERLP